MIIQVCIGSACHKRGSYHVMKKAKELITQHGLEDSVTVQAAFCLGQCANGISIKVDDKLILGVSKDNLEETFNQYVLKSR
ncbi:MAG: NAD(P)H-dependent oxidoreductase subunit E [Peptococcaceae bacterium]|nr:NAD(P)H-dependent oxidoreductase subunit E [Peptococcaceae bacterium]